MVKQLYTNLTFYSYSSTFKSNEQLHIIQIRNVYGTLNKQNILLALKPELIHSNVCEITAISAFGNLLRNTSERKKFFFFKKNIFLREILKRKISGKKRQVRKSQIHHYF